MDELRRLTKTDRVSDRQDDKGTERWTDDEADPWRTNSHHLKFGHITDFLKAKHCVFFRKVEKLALFRAIV